MPDVKSNGPVPHRRFPEFRDAGPWEVKRLGEVCSTFSGGTPNSSRKDFYGGTIPFIRSAEIDQESTELFITENGLINSSAKLIKKGDLLIALYGANSGDASIAKLDGAINQAILCLRSTFDLRFILNYWLLRKEPIIQKYIQGGQGNLSGDIVKSIEFAFPTITEQQKIADCLSSLDDLIRAEEAALEALNEHKKGLMQQLFPREGETTPRLRFPEFRDAGPWEVKRLREIAESLTSLSGKTSKDFGHGNAFYVPYTNVYENVFVDPNKLERVDIGPNENQNTIRRGDILFTVSSETPDEAGMSSVVVHDISNCYVNSFCTIYRPIQNIRLNTFFAGYYLRSPIVRDHFLKTAQGAIRFNLNREAFQKTPFLLPRLPEQEKIADCLASLDDLIRGQGERIESLKQHKKGLMQQLFPQETTA